MNVLVTGAGGFMGGVVCQALMAQGHRVRGAIRRSVPLPEGVVPVSSPDLGPDADWSPLLDGVDCVIHLAARAHVMNDTETDPLAVFRRINRDGAIRLAEQAAAAGVRRFVFVSTIKVNGEATEPGHPFRAEDAPAPCDPYGIAKAEAETALADIAARTGLSLAVVRPPLVHGPGVKGNLASLMGALRRGLPLPLGAIDNRRSLVGLGNLAHGLAFLAGHSATGIFLIRDGEDVSSAELIRRLARAMGRKPRLIPIPVGALRLAGSVLGKGAAIKRLTGSLQVDDSPLRSLGWVPPYDLNDGLAAMAQDKE